MFSLLAFKSLCSRQGTLVSPQQETPWRREYIAPLGKVYYLEAGLGDVDRSYGVFAASFKEARGYGDKVYLVAPDPRFPVVEGAEGWRAGAAFVVDGPFDESNLERAAKIIISAHNAGYPQVKGILGWAAFVGQEAELLAEYGNAEQLYNAALGFPDDKFSRCLLLSLVKAGDPEYLFLAGLNLPGARWDEIIAAGLANIDMPRAKRWILKALTDWHKYRLTPAFIDAVIRSGDSEVIYYATKYLPNNASEQDPLSALLKTGDAKQLYIAGYSLPDEKFTPAITEALLAMSERAAYWLAKAGDDWPDERFTPAITEALVKSNSAEALCLAMSQWSNERYVPAIAEALAACGNAYFIYKASWEAPGDRWIPELTRAIAKAANARLLLEIAQNWKDFKFDPVIVDAIVATRNAEILRDAGELLSRARWNPAITEALIACNDAKCLLSAACNWPDERFTPALIEAFVKLATPQLLYDAGIRLPSKRWSYILTDALIKSGDAKYLCEAACNWPDDKYVPEILEAIVEIGDGEYLYKAGLNPKSRWTPAIAKKLARCKEAWNIYNAVQFWPDDRYDPVLREALLALPDDILTKSYIGYLPRMKEMKAEGRPAERNVNS